MRVPRALTWPVSRIAGAYDGLCWIIDSSTSYFADGMWRPLSAADAAGKDGTGLLATLATFAVTQGGALSFAAKYTDQKWLLLVFFSALALLTIVAILIVLRLPADSVQPPVALPGLAHAPLQITKHFYDKATIAFGYWTLTIALLVPSVILTLVALDIISPPSKRIPFPPGDITCLALSQENRPGTDDFSLIGDLPSSMKVRRSQNVLGRWLASGSEAEKWDSAEGVMAYVKTLVADAVLSKDLDKLAKTFGDYSVSHVRINQADGLYAVRQKVPFNDYFQEFRCLVEIRGAKEATGGRGEASRLAFLVKEGDHGEPILRQVFFDWSPSNGMLNSLRVEPDKGESLLVFVYLVDTASPEAVIKVSS